MTTAANLSSATTTRRMSVAWPPFEKRLATALAKLEEDQFLILCVKGTNRFVQFAAQGSHGMRMEATSNAFLKRKQKLSTEQIAQMIAGGWRGPTGAHHEATPELDPDGSPNFYREFPRPVRFKRLATLAVQTLREIMGVPHPLFLQYEAYDTQHRTQDLSELGLMRSARGARGDDQSAAMLTERLLSTLKAATGVEDLAADADGDIPLAFNGSPIYFSVIGGSSLIRICAPILERVAANPKVFELLNELNAGRALLRLVYRDTTLFAVADHVAQPYVGVHVETLLKMFSEAVSTLGARLQPQIGGRTAHDLVAPGATVH